MSKKKTKENWFKRLMKSVFGAGKKAVEGTEIEAGYDEQQGKYAKVKKTVKF